MTSSVCNPAGNRNLTRSTLLGGSWQLTSVASYAVLQLIVLGVLARLVTPADFGLLSAANMVAGLAATFTHIGLGPALIQRQGLRPEHLSTAFTVAVLLALLGVLFLWCCAPLAALFFHNPEMRDVLRIVSLSLMMSGVGVVPEAILQKSMRFKEIMQASVGGYVLGYAIVSLLFAWFGYGVWSLVAGILGNSIAKSLLLLMLSRWRIQFGFSQNAFRELVVYGGGQTMMRLFNFTALQVDYLVVGRRFGSATLGLYERAFSLMLLPGRYLGDVLDGVLFPAMSQIQDDVLLMRHVYLCGVAIVNLLLFPFSWVVLVWANEIVSLLLGPQWLEAVLPFQALAVGMSLRTTVRLGDALVRASGRVYLGSLAKAGYAIMILIGSGIGAVYGVTGVAVGVSIASLINFVVMSYLASGIVKVNWFHCLAKLRSGVLIGLLFLVLNVGLRFLTSGLSSEPAPLLTVVFVSNISSLWIIWCVKPHWFGQEFIGLTLDLMAQIPDKLRVKLSFLVPPAVERWLLER